MHEEIGTVAGVIWQALNAKGELSLLQLNRGEGTSFRLGYRVACPRGENYGHNLDPDSEPGKELTITRERFDCRSYRARFFILPCSFITPKPDRSVYSIASSTCSFGTAR
jgi:hypothetical protein